MYLVSSGSISNNQSVNLFDQGRGLRGSLGVRTGGRDPGAWLDSLSVLSVELRLRRRRRVDMECDSNGGQTDARVQAIQPQIEA